MKKWNAPEVTELSINETANGIFPALFESCLTDNILDCGNKGPETNENENNKGETDTDMNS